MPPLYLIIQGMYTGSRAGVADMFSLQPRNSAGLLPAQHDKLLNDPSAKDTIDPCFPN